MLFSLYPSNHQQITSNLKSKHIKIKLSDIIHSKLKFNPTPL